MENNYYLESLIEFEKVLKKEDILTLKEPRITPVV